MATGISVKLTADVGGFKKGISEATQSVKTLDAQLETNEKQLKLNGDAELYMSNKSALLEKQLEAQRKVVVNTQNALEAMRKNGVSETSTEFQKMEQNLAKAQTKMVEIQTNLQEVKTGAGGAKDEAKGMNTELKNIGKGVAFENITNGLKEITSKLESGARAAVNFGKKVARSAMDSTEWADDVLTRATQNGVDAETIQRMDNVSKYIDTDVDTIIAAKTRLAKNKGSLGDLLGIESPESVEDAFWRAGEAIMAMTDEFEQEEAAQKIFGRGWKELIPLFTAGQEEYERLMAEQNVLTNEQVQKLGEADNQFQKIKQEVELLKNQFWAENSQTIIDLLQWVVDNKNGVVAAITAIGGAFALLKVGELATNIAKVVNGFKQITSLGGGGGGTSTGGSGGSGGGGSGGGGSTGGGSGVGWLGTAKAAISGFLADIAPFVAGEAAVISAALAVPLIEQNRSIEETRKTQKQLEEAAEAMKEAGNENAELVERAAAATGLVKDANGAEAKNILGMSYTQMSDEYGDLLMGLKSRQGAEMAKLVMALQGKTTLGNDAWNQLNRYWNGNDLDPMEVSDLLKTVTNALVQQAQNGVNNPAAGLGPTQALPNGWIYQGGYYRKVDENGKETGEAKKAGYMTGDEFSAWIAEENAKYEQNTAALQDAADEMASLPEATAAAVKDAMSDVTIVVQPASQNANGLFSVPWDGYPAILHKGERVLPASEAQRYTYNTYFGNVNLHNGLEVDALAESIERNNRRKRAGYGAA